LKLLRATLVPAAFALIAIATGARAASTAAHAVASPGTHAALIALYHLLRTGVALAFAVFTIGRAEPHRHARSPLALGACVLATVAVLAFEAPNGSSNEVLIFAGDLVAVLACLWLLASVLALGRCFGILPEARGLVTRGPYRLVRHPVYLGELSASGGLALASSSVRNALVLMLLAAMQLTRMGFEERALSRAFPDYLTYAARTPRLIPFVGLFSRLPARTRHLRGDFSQRSLAVHSLSTISDVGLGEANRSSHSGSTPSAYSRATTKPSLG
jgi:protein-S-isoprenylcysteine O-methyltransferase Ste14